MLSITNATDILMLRVVMAAVEGRSLVILSISDSELTCNAFPQSECPLYILSSPTLSLPTSVVNASRSDNRSH
jgi:hypothetical protein